jgi:YVTN family beta-propeller protein
VVLDSQSNQVLAQIPLDQDHFALDVVVSPDGKHAYVTIFTAGSGFISLLNIDTATKKVVAVIPIGDGPGGIGIVPPPTGIPFFTYKSRNSTSASAAPSTGTPLTFTHISLWEAPPETELLPTSNQSNSRSAILRPPFRQARSKSSGTGLSPFKASSKARSSQQRSSRQVCWPPCSTQWWRALT